MSHSSISRPEIEKIARIVLGPDAQYTEAAGEGAIHIGSTIIVHGKVDTYAPRAGRALFGRWLVDELEKQQKTKQTRTGRT